MQPKEINSLQAAIRATHGCESEYTGSVYVRDLFWGQVAWDGFVAIFTLLKCRAAERCYAWSYEHGGETKTSTVLEVPPVDSAELAVKVGMAAAARKAGTHEGSERR